jgi:hypothetical protein
VAAAAGAAGLPAGAAAVLAVADSAAAAAAAGREVEQRVCMKYSHAEITKPHLLWRELRRRPGVVCCILTVGCNFVVSG